MDYSYTPQVLSLLFSALIMVSLAAYTWSHRGMPGAGPFAVTMLLGSWWAMTTVLEIAVSGLSAKLFWTDARYVCYAATPVTTLLSVLQYTGRDQWLTRRRIALLSVIPLVTIALAWTNDMHGLVRSGAHLVGAWLPVIAEDFGPWFWIHVIYSFSLLLFCFLALAEAIVRAPRIYRGQPLALFVGLALPAVSRILYYRVLNPVPQVDLTPFTLGLAGLVFSWGLIRYRLFDTILVARDVVIEGIGDGVIVLNSRQQIIDLSPSAAKTFGKQLKDIIGMTAAQTFSNWPDFAGICSGLEPTQADFAMGSQLNARYFEVHATPLSDNLNRPKGRVIVMRDVTERKRSQELFTAIAVSSPIGIYVVSSGKFRFVNPQFQKQTGFEESQLIGTNSLSLVVQEDRDTVRVNALKMLRGEVSQPYEYRFTNAEGKVRWAMETVAHIQYEDGPATLGSFMDITDRKEQEDKLAYLATHDSLTGLPNRNVLYECLPRAVAKAQRDTESTLLLFDLDAFKDVNDSLGHPAGDRVLAMLAELLQNQLRAGDLFVRLGGDEFAVLLEGTMLEEGFLIASRMKDAATNHSFHIEGRLFKISLSIGLVKIDGLETPEKLISQGDSAMYEAKQQGGNRIVVFQTQEVQP